MNRRCTGGRAAATALVALALLASACGGGGDSKSASTKGTTTTTESTTTSTSVAPDETTTTVALAAPTTTVAKSTASLTKPRSVAPKQAAGVANVVAAPTTTVAPATIKRGGTLTWAARTEATAGFDPTQSTTAARAQFREIFDTLVETDASGNLIPRLAEAVTSTDAITWNIKLRANLKFTDGTPLNAAAVIYNWKRIADAANKSPSISVTAQWASFDAVDDLNVKVVLKQANGQFPRTIDLLNAIGSPKALADKGAGFSTDPVGAGPFIFKSWKRDDTLTLDRNPNYWETGKPYVDHLVMRQVAEISQRYNSIKTGEIDCGVFTEDPAFFDTAKKDGLNAGTNVELIGGRDVKFNTGKAPFNDVRARRAVAYAIDRSGFNKTVYKGIASEPATLINQPSPYYDATAKFLTYDPVKAQGLFDDLAKDGKSLTFAMTATPSTQSFAEYVQATMQSFKNVKMNITIIQSSQAAGIQASGDFDSLAAQFGGSGDPDQFLYTVLHSGLASNVYRFSNTDMDNALDTGRTSLDFKTRYAAYQTVQKIIVDQVPFTVVVGVPSGNISSKTAKGCETPLVSVLPFPDFNQVWLDR